MPVNCDGEFFTPSTEALEFSHEVLNFTVRDGESGNETKSSGVITAILQFGDDGVRLGIVEFCHALVNELASLSMAYNMGKSFDFIHHPTSLMFVERLEIDADQNSAAVNQGKR